MRTLSIAAAVVALAFGPVAPAGAEPPAVHGPLCHFYSTSPGVFTGGPVAVVAGDPSGNPVSVTLTCSIRSGATHTAPVIASASASGTSVVTLPPTPFDWDVEPDTVVSLCTALTVVDAHGETHRLYWNPYSGGGDGRFSTSDTAACDLPCTLEYPSSCTPPCEDDAIQLHCIVPAVLDLVDAVFIDVVDPAVCPVLAQMFPPEGDVDYPVLGDPLWDCPPYAI